MNDFKVLKIKNHLLKKKSLSRIIKVKNKQPFGDIYKLM